MSDRVRKAIQLIGVQVGNVLYNGAQRTFTHEEHMRAWRSVDDALKAFDGFSREALPLSPREPFGPPWPKAGYAPGGYAIFCIDCDGDGDYSVTREGCDKRAIRCKSCAEKAWNAGNN